MDTNSESPQLLTDYKVKQVLDMYWTLDSQRLNSCSFYRHSEVIMWCKAYTAIQILTQSIGIYKKNTNQSVVGSM